MKYLNRILSWIQDDYRHRLVPSFSHGGPIDFINRLTTGFELHLSSTIHAFRFLEHLRDMKLIRGVLLVLLCSNSVAEEIDPAADSDPWRGMNQVTHRFNEKADKFILRPMAKGYMAITPGPIRRRISSFFANLRDVETGINNLLQGKPGEGASDFLRIITNTTIGLGGFFDPATRFGLTKHTESFGQTLTVWGVPAGPYVVLPLFGPRTLTDALTNPLNPRLDPVRYLYPVDHRNMLFGLRAVDDRASLIPAESIVTGDRYIFIREAYLQRRNYLVLDGEVEDTFDDF
jgi:phospholipid-binding lipoprotein MlaA